MCFWHERDRRRRERRIRGVLGTCVFFNSIFKCRKNICSFLRPRNVRNEGRGRGFPFACKVYSPVNNPVGSDKNGRNLIGLRVARNAATDRPTCRRRQRQCFVSELREKRNRDKLHRIKESPFAQWPTRNLIPRVQGKREWMHDKGSYQSRRCTCPSTTTCTFYCLDCACFVLVICSILRIKSASGNTRRFIGAETAAVGPTCSPPSSSSVSQPGAAVPLSHYRNSLTLDVTSALATIWWQTSSSGSPVSCRWS